MATPGFLRCQGRIDRHSLVSELGVNLLHVQPPSFPSDRHTSSPSEGRCAIGHLCCPLPPESSLCAPASLHTHLRSLMQPLRQPLSGMSCPGRHCITAIWPPALEGCCYSDSDGEKADVWVQDCSGASGRSGLLRVGMVRSQYHSASIQQGIFSY